MVVMLVIVTFVIGLIIGIILYFFFIGGLNTVITDFIWSTTIESSWKTLLIHGLALFLISLVADIPGYLLILSSPSLATSIGVLLVYSFVDGFIGKNVAFVWEERAGYTGSQEVEAPEETKAEKSGTEEQEVELLYDKLVARYTDHWGALLGAQLLDEEIKAYTWQGETFAEAVKKVYERQQRQLSK
jgi:hypothetical protein